MHNTQAYNSYVCHTHVNSLLYQKCYCTYNFISSEAVSLIILAHAEFWCQFGVFSKRLKRVSYSNRNGLIGWLWNKRLQVKYSLQCFDLAGCRQGGQVAEW